MSTKNYDSRYSLAKILILGILLLGTNQLFSQDTTATGSTMGRLDLPDPASIQNLYTYDPITDRYILTRTIGSVDISYPIILTPAEYEELVMKELFSDLVIGAILLGLVIHSDSVLAQRAGFSSQLTEFSGSREGEQRERIETDRHLLFTAEATDKLCLQ